MSLRASNKKQLQLVPLYLAITFAVIVFVLPIFWMLSFSLRSTEMAFEPTLWPTKPTLAQFASLLTKKDIGVPLFNSFKVALASTCLSLALALFAGYGLSRSRSRMVTPLLLFVVSSKVFPGVLLAIAYFTLMTRIGAYDTHWSLILIDAMYVLPFSIWMLRNYLGSVPKALDEAAMIDGCSRAGTLFRIILPVSLPGIVATFTYGFLLSWNEYLYALTFVMSNQKKLVTVAMTELIGQWWTNTAQLMAFSAISTIPLMVLFLFIQKYLVQGLVAHVEKG